MVRPSDDEIDGLLRVAQEIRDSSDESGYAVDVAIAQHDAFTHTRGPASQLERSLISDAARRGAVQAGFSAEEVSGGLDIIAMSDVTIRRYRLKRVRVNAVGQLVAICGVSSTLLVSDPDSMFPQEKWILGYVTSDDHTIDRLFAAEVVDWRGSGPVQLLLGPIIDLSGTQPPRGFVSTDEDLEGFEEDGGHSADAV